MVVPGMYDLAKVIAESSYTEEDVFDCGVTGEIVFLVVVPELGACRVSNVALSHFMAGADEFHADAMPEHWSNTLSGKWTIKRERLRILAASWDRFSNYCTKLAEDLDDDSDAVLLRLYSLPTVEAKRWDAAYAEKDGRRQIKSEQAGLSGVCLLTLKQFCEEVEGRTTRWLHGRYEVCEAAQILADANPGTEAISGINAEVLCRQMEDAIHAGKLIVRQNGIPVPASSFTQHRLYLQTVLISDVNDWLNETRANYALTYPYGLGSTATADDEATPQKSPEYQAAYAQAWEALDRMPAVEKDIQEWENAQPVKVVDKQEKVRNLAALKKELAALQELVNPSQTEQGLSVHSAPPVDADNAQEKQVVAMKKVALIAELEFEWRSINTDLSEATRNGLKAAAHTGKHGEWDKDKARAWAVSKGKIKQAAPVHTLAAAWPGAVTRHTINH